MSIGVPGELKGYWTAHKRFGKLSWKEIVQPSVDLCERGWNMSLHQHDSIRINKRITEDANLKYVPLIQTNKSNSRELEPEYFLDLY